MTGNITINPIPSNYVPSGTPGTPGTTLEEACYTVNGGTSKPFPDVTSQWHNWKNFGVGIKPKSLTMTRSDDLSDNGYYLYSSTTWTFGSEASGKASAKINYARTSSPASRTGYLTWTSDGTFYFSMVPRYSNSSGGYWRYCFKLNY